MEEDSKRLKRRAEKILADPRYMSLGGKSPRGAGSISSSTATSADESGLFDVSCYVCGTFLRLSVDLPGDVPPNLRCEFCGESAPFWTRAGDRRRLSELRQMSPPFEGTGEAAGEEEDRGGRIWFRHGELLREVGESLPPPPALGTDSGDQRFGRHSQAVGRAYAERLRQEVESVAPDLPITTHPRTGDEEGGPGIEFDYVQIALGGIAAWGIAKIADELTALIGRLRELSRDDLEIDEVVASHLARGALAQQFNVPDADVVINQRLTVPGDYQERTYSLYVLLRQRSDHYQVVLTRGGQIIGVTPLALPEPPQYFNEPQPPGMG